MVPKGWTRAKIKMEVRCERCETEYDFDDALISDRGTTVRCTSCGHEFQVFASVAHVDFEVTTTSGDVYHFESLAELQRAIMNGAVREDDVLRRGNDAARALGTIVELVPLLRQSRSVPPPAPIASTMPESFGEPVTVPPGTRTRIGLPTVDDLAKAGGRVPSKLMERPRIHSPLSVRPIEPAPVSEMDPPSPRAKLPSLSDTLLGRPARTTPVPTPLEPRSSGESEDDVVDAPEPLPSSFPPPSISSAQPPTLPPQSRVGVVKPILAEAPVFERDERLSAPAVEEASRSPRPSVQSATDLGRYAREAHALATERTSGSLPGKPRARLAPLVFALLAGGAALYAFVSRERWLPGPQTAATSTKLNEGSKTLSRDALLKLETESLRLRFLGRDRSAVFAEAKTFLPLAENASRDVPSIEFIDLLRLSGDTASARRKLAERAASAVGADTTEQYPLSLALLEIEDGTSTPPWSIIVERLRLAAQKEDAPYLAQSTLVWALMNADRLDEAKIALVDLKRQKSIGESPLLGPLVALMEGRTSSGTPSDANANEVELAPVGIDGEKDSDKPRPVGPEVKKLVSEADGYWAVGDREAAVRVYRQIFRKVGPDHFLGQRAMARIKQAERELAEKSSN